MGSSQSKLQYIDNESKLIVHGYIRQIEKIVISDHHEIPTDIKNLCLLYYFDKTEEFDKHSRLLQISSINDKHNNLVEHTQNKSWYSVYGQFIVDPESNPYSVYKWTLKYGHVHSGSSPSIGIVGADGDLPTEKYCFMNPTNYDYFAWESAWSGLRDKENTNSLRYGSNRRPRNGDVIIMELNVTNNSLNRIPFSWICQ